MVSCVFMFGFLYLYSVQYSVYIDNKSKDKVRAPIK